MALLGHVVTVRGLKLATGVGSLRSFEEMEAKLELFLLSASRGLTSMILQFKVRRRNLVINVTLLNSWFSFLDRTYTPFSPANQLVGVKLKLIIDASTAYQALSLFQLNLESSGPPVCHTVRIDYVLNQGTPISSLPGGYLQRPLSTVVDLLIFDSMCIEAHLIEVSVLTGQLQVLLFICI